MKNPRRDQWPSKGPGRRDHEKIRFAKMTQQSQRGDWMKGKWKRKGTVGNTKKLVIEFANITSYPVQDQYEDPKTQYMINSDAHIMATVETHLRHTDMGQVSRLFRGRCKWTLFNACAQQSKDSDNGTYGGALIQARSLLALSPMPGAEKPNQLWNWGASHFFTGVFVHMKKGSISVITAYFRGGIDSPEGIELWMQLREVCKGTLYIILADLTPHHKR